MNQPPDDFHNNQTENSLWPRQGQNSGPGYPQQAPYPPNQGQAGFPPPQPQGFPPPQGFPTQASSPDYGEQTAPWGGFSSPPQPGSYAGQQPPVFSPVTPGAYPNQQPGFSPVTPGAYPNQPANLPPPGGYLSPQQGGGYPNVPPVWADPNQNNQRPKKSRTGLIIVSVLLIVLVIAAGAGVFLVTRARNNGPTPNATKVAGTTATTVAATPTLAPTTGPTTGNTGSIGQPIQGGLIWVVTLTHASVTTASDIPPTPGQTYLEISLALKNVSATSQAVSSILEFSLKDSSGKSYNELQAVGDTNIKQYLDGNVAANQTLNGQIPYEVPLTTHDFVLTFEYGLITGSTAAISWPIHV